MLLSYIAGPVIGSVIGYCTNFIAVKMLFYPRNEVMVLGKKLPFTPGAIPKGKPRLAKAIGEVVGNQLVTKEDLEAQLFSPEMMEGIADSVSDMLAGSIRQSLIGATKISDDTYEAGKEKVASVLAEEIATSLSGIDFQALVAEKGVPVVKNMVRGTMLEMFMSDELILGVTGPIGAELQNMMVNNGAEYAKPFVSAKLDEIGEGSVISLMERFDIPEPVLKGMISSVIASMMKGAAAKLATNINITGIVTEKINQMSVEELEQVVLTVMKKELNMIVNLGALIGFILGILNVFI